MHSTLSHNTAGLINIAKNPATKKKQYECRKTRSGPVFMHRTESCCIAYCVRETLKFIGIRGFNFLEPMPDKIVFLV